MIKLKKKKNDTSNYGRSHCFIKYEVDMTSITLSCLYIYKHLVYNHGANLCLVSNLVCLYKILYSCLCLFINNLLIFLLLDSLDYIYVTSSFLLLCHKHVNFILYLQLSVNFEIKLM